MKEIQLTQGKVAQVSDHRYEDLMTYNWRAHFNRGKWYAFRKGRVWEKNKSIAMHRQIMNAPDGVEIDHIDGDGLNNKDENLRFCTHSQNSANRVDSKNTSGYKGVVWSKAGSKWQSQIIVNRQYIYLGYFGDIEDAARAYDEAAKKYFGEFARLNFPEKAGDVDMK
jgi:hypothetical protein